MGRQSTLAHPGLSIQRTENLPRPSLICLGSSRMWSPCPGQSAGVWEGATLACYIALRLTRVGWWEFVDATWRISGRTGRPAGTPKRDGSIYVQRKTGRQVGSRRKRRAQARKTGLKRTRITLFPPSEVFMNDMLHNSSHRQVQIKQNKKISGGRGRVEKKPG